MLGAVAVRRGRETKAQERHKGRRDVSLGDICARRNGCAGRSSNEKIMALIVAKFQLLNYAITREPGAPNIFRQESSHIPALRVKRLLLYQRLNRLLFVFEGCVLPESNEMYRSPWNL